MLLLKTLSFTAVEKLTIMAKAPERAAEAALRSSVFLSLVVSLIYSNLCLFTKNLSKSVSGCEQVIKTGAKVEKI